MNDIAQHLDRIGGELSSVVRSALGAAGLAAASDGELLRVLAMAAELGRLADAVMVEATGHIVERDDSAERVDRIASQKGCRDTNELLRRATRCSAQRAAELQRCARGVHRRTALTSGELLPARFPQLRAALTSGSVAAEALGGVLRVLEQALPAATTEQRLGADEELAASACGTAPGGQPPADADELRLQAHVWAMVLDQDGAEPRDDRAVRRREVRLGRARDGLVSLRGNLLVEVAAQLQTLFDAHNNPKRQGPTFAEAPPDGDDDGPFECLADRRTMPQRQHDALAAILIAAAGSADSPSLGGAAPTLTVAVRAEDLVAGTGYAHLDGVDEPVPLHVARHTACCGKIERITFDGFGRILDIQVQDRTFRDYQRRAIAVRDGGCIIPGCTVRATWCEIHHVAEHADGGRTSTDNGVALCWFHHRTLGSSGWEVRITGGVPQVRSPQWWDPRRRWRAANKHPVWMRPRPAARTG